MDTFDPVPPAPTRAGQVIALVLSIVAAAPITIAIAIELLQLLSGGGAWLGVSVVYMGLLTWWFVLPAAGLGFVIGLRHRYGPHPALYRASMLLSIGAVLGFLLAWPLVWW